MNFYRRRPLALIITLCLLTLAAVYFLPGLLKIVLVLLIAALTPIIIKIIRRIKTTAICNLAPTSFVLICAALLLVTVLMSFAYYDVYAAHCGELGEGTICAKVISVEQRTSYSAVYEVRLTSRDGKRINAKGLLGSQSAVSLNVGDIIEADVTFCALEEFYTYRDTHRPELLAEGYVFTCNTLGNVVISGQGGGIDVMLSRLREDFGAKISLYLDSKSAALANALLLGERGGLGKTGRDFTYVGATHLLALSGLHLTIIGGGFERLLSRFRVGTRARYAAVTALIIFYVALTGFIVSAIRAAIMLVLSYVSELFYADSDRITSLFFAVWLIALVNPTAVYDVSLQLSFLATLGVLLISEPASRFTASRLTRKGILQRAGGALLGVLSAAAVSVGAVMFVLPLQWIYFGEASLMAVPATLILSVLCEGILALLVPLLIFALFQCHFICTAIGGTVRVLSEICAYAAEKLSEYSTLVSLGYPFTFAIMLACVSVIVWMTVCDFPNWLYALIPFFAASVIFLGAARIYDAVSDDRVTIDFASIAANDVVMLVSERSAAIVDLGGGSTETMYAAMDFLAGRYITEVETLVLTSIERRHTGAVLALLNNRRTAQILMPKPNDEYEMYIAADIISLAREYGTRTVFFDNSGESEAVHGDVRITISERASLSRSDKALHSVIFTYGGTSAAYVGASAWENDLIWDFADGAEYMIFGSSGPTVKSSPTGTVSTDTKVVCAANDEIAAALSEWLLDFEGTLCVDDKLSLIINP